MENAKRFIADGHGSLQQELAKRGMAHHIGTCSGPANRPLIMVDGKMVLQFGSLDILGLGGESCVIQRAVEDILEYGTGCPGTRSLLDFEVYRELSQRMMEFKGEDVFFANTGYQASKNAIEILSRNAIALNQPLPKEKRYKTAIFYDELSHNSLQSAIGHHDGPTFRHKHLNYAQLEKQLENHAKDFPGMVLLVADALYSMNGTFADTPTLIRLAKKYDGIVVLDGAHSDGVYGTQGKGVLEMQGVPPEDHDYVVQVGVFSKAFASIGGYITLPKETCEIGSISVPEYMFTVGRPLHIVATNIFVIDLAMSELGEARRQHVWQMSEMFRKIMLASGFDTLDSQSHIVPIVVGSEKECYRLKQYLFDEHSIFVNAIPRSVVKNGNALLRISVSAYHTEEHMSRLIGGITAAREMGIKFRSPSA